MAESNHAQRFKRSLILPILSTKLVAAAATTPPSILIIVTIKYIITLDPNMDLRLGCKVLITQGAPTISLQTTPLSNVSEFEFAKSKKERRLL